MEPPGFTKMVFALATDAETSRAANASAMEARMIDLLCDVRGGPGALIARWPCGVHSSSDRARGAGRGSPRAGRVACAPDAMHDAPAAGSEDAKIECPLSEPGERDRDDRDRARGHHAPAEPRRPAKREGNRQEERDDGELTELDAGVEAHERESDRAASEPELGED